jgi:hypothetical protein
MGEAKGTLSDVLKGGDWQHFSEFDGQIVTVLGYETREGRTPDGNKSEWPIIDALTGDQDEVKISGTKNMLSQLQRMEAAGFEFPVELRIYTFKNPYGGKPGGGLADPND